MPTSNQIDTAIKNIPQFFNEPRILNGECFLTKKGKPFCRPGGLCRVYKYKLSDGSVKALRIWTDIISEAKERSIAISDFIKNNPSRFFVDFECVENALTIDGEDYPVVLMEWCNGINMKDYISQCVRDNDIDKIKKLASEFYDLCVELENLGVSHGDLHHDNLLIQDDGSIKLIDYDSMYVPALKGYKDECMGYEGYQHPTAREKNEYLQPYTDYFSELIIYLTLYIVAYHPEHWDEDRVADLDKALLFKISELDPKTVNQYRDWSAPGLPMLIEWYKRFLKKEDLKELKSLSYILDVAGIEKKQVRNTQTTIVNKPVAKVDITNILKKW